jgi:hypothetical protein
MNDQRPVFKPLKPAVPVEQDIQFHISHVRSLPLRDAESQVDRARNRRKLKTAQRMLKNAKNENQRAMARASVRMLQEMLR